MRVVLWFAVSLGAALVGCGLNAIGTGETALEDAGVRDAGVAVADGSPGVDGAAFATDAGQNDSGAPPSLVSTISPYDPSGKLTYPTAIDWQLATDVPAAIHFTIDGTKPTLSSPGGPSPVTVSKPPDGTKIMWIAGADPTVHEFDVGVDPSASGKTVAYGDGFTFTANDSHIIVATPGQSLSLHVADAWEWNSGSSCPTCIDQLKFGFDTTLGCVIDTEPNTYPGAHVNNVTLTPNLQAPTAKGTYDIHLGFEQNFTCNDTLGHGLGTTVVATIIVR